MKILDLEPGSEITIEIKVQDHKLEFHTHIIEQLKDAAVIEPIRIDGKILSLGSENITINILYNKEDAPPLTWNYVALPAAVYKGETCYKCSVEADGISQNRRGAYRLSVGLKGRAKIGTKKNMIPVLVREISETGFSFIDYKEKEEIHTFIDDPVLLIFDDEETHISVVGRIVRLIDDGEDKRIYACRVEVENHEIAKYIAKKQRERLTLEMKQKRGKKAAATEKGAEADRKTNTDKHEANGEVQEKELPGK